MAIKLLVALYDFPAGTIVRDLSYDLERRLVEFDAVTYDLSGGVEATVPTFKSGLSAQEKWVLSLEQLLLVNRGDKLEPINTIKIEDLTTDETDTSLVAKPDGEGGVDFVADSANEPHAPTHTSFNSEFADNTSAAEAGTYSVQEALDTRVNMNVALPVAKTIRGFQVLVESGSAPTTSICGVNLYAVDGSWEPTGPVLASGAILGVGNETLFEGAIGPVELPAGNYALSFVGSPLAPAMNVSYSTDAPPDGAQPLSSYNGATWTIQAGEYIVGSLLTVEGGSDKIDGDLVEMDFVPANSTPEITGTDATSTDQLAAILKGMDVAMAASHFKSVVSIGMTAGTNVLDTIDIDDSANLAWYLYAAISPGTSPAHQRTGVLMVQINPSGAVVPAELGPKISGDGNEITFDTNFVAGIPNQVQLRAIVAGSHTWNFAAKRLSV